MQREEQVAEYLSDLAYKERPDDDLAFDLQLLDDRDDVRLYQDLMDDTYFIVHRGTTANTRDFYADVSIFNGTVGDNNLFLRRRELTGELIDALPSEGRVVLTGHSLGGTTAVHSLIDKRIDNRVARAIVFSPGTSPFYNMSSAIQSHDKITRWRRDLDPISAFDFPGTTKRGKTKFFSKPLLPFLSPFSIGGLFGNIANWSHTTSYSFQ